jgi:hypothetical protein
VVAIDSSGIETKKKMLMGIRVTDEKTGDNKEFKSVFSSDSRIRKTFKDISGFCL